MAGGLGKRARSIDSSLPKPLIPIAGKPILLWEFECLVSQGYTDIILTVSYKAEMIESYFGDGSSFAKVYEETLSEATANDIYAIRSEDMDGQYVDAPLTQSHTTLCQWALFATG